MRQPLHRLKEVLRAETCPPQVLAKVRDRIAKERPPARPIFAARNLALAVMVMLLILVLRHWFPGVSSRPNPEVAQTEPLTAMQVANETHLSLACIGSTLVEAGSRTETILINRVKPRLIDSLDRASKAIANQLPL